MSMNDHGTVAALTMKKDVGQNGQEEQRRDVTCEQETRNIFQFSYCVM
jgi:hypothetical protein